jgi:hypothetical protein
MISLYVVEVEVVRERSRLMLTIPSPLLAPAGTRSLPHIPISHQRAAAREGRGKQRADTNYFPYAGIVVPPRSPACSASSRLHVPR